MEEAQKLFHEILKKIRLRENGEIVELMNRNGLLYKKNFGVSILFLREIASEYEKDSNLASLLRNENIRETRILAEMIEDPDKISFEEAELVLMRADNVELAEQMSVNLLSKLPFAHLLCRKNIFSKNKSVQTAVLLTIGRLALNKKTENSEDFLLYLTEIEKMIPNCENNIQNIAFRVLFQIGSGNQFLKTKTEAILNNLIKSDSSKIQMLADDTICLLKYQTFE